MFDRPKYGQEPRLSRIDHSRKSNIPRLNYRNDSTDRVSGVRPLEHGLASASRSSISRSNVKSRHRSAETHRQTFSNNRPRPQSAQRHNIQQRPYSMIHSNLETPLSRTCYSKDSLVTPMSAISLNNHRVSRARTPSSERTKSQRYYLEKIISAQANRDKRPVSDLSWQKSTEARVSSRLKEDSVIQSILPPGAAPLRPITIRLFVEITNHLLKCAGTRFEIDTSNYVNRLPQIAQRLLYPGVMSKSWLISVNTMHSYPNVLAFLSYLIDFADNQENIKNSMDWNILYGDDENGQIQRLRHEYYFETWRLFQVRQDFQTVTTKHIEDLKYLNNISDEDYQERQAHLKEIQKKKKEIEASVDKIKLVDKSLDHELMTLKGRGNHLKDLKKELSQQLYLAEKSLENKKIAIEATKNFRLDLQNQIKTLREQLSNQKMTLEDREKILEEVDSLNYNENFNNELLLQVEKIIFEKDIELVAEQKKTFSISLSVNKLLLTIGSSLGQDFRHLSLNPRDLLLEETPDNIKNTSNLLKEILVKTENELQSMQNQKEVEVSHLHQIKHETDVLKDHTKSLSAKIPDFEKRIESKKAMILSAKNKKEALEIERRKLHEKKTNQEKMLNEANDKLAYWKDQDSQWQKNLKQLRDDEPKIREECKQRADAVIAECFSIVEELQPIMTSNTSP